VNNLHRISGNEESSYIKATLWWITVYAAYEHSNTARIYNGTVHRIWDEFQDVARFEPYKQSTGSEIIQIWIEAGKPEYREDRVLRG
jgi:hypothetical protein